MIIKHLPVLKKEIIEYLNPQPNENFIDCTFGQGGDSLTILEKNKPQGKVLAIEADEKLYQEMKSERVIAKRVIAKRLILINDNFCHLKEIVEREKFKPVSGILLDLGLSWWHLEKSKRGFSFQENEFLDMRFDLRKKLKAEEIINQWPEKEIGEIFRKYGQERFAKIIAKKIGEIRKIGPIKTTFQLREIIKKATPSWYHRLKIHPATRAFQALRIAVNDELNNLEKVLPQTIEVLERGGRLVVISFHSLEERIVKNFFRQRKNQLKILTKKPILPSKKEMAINPRSRSAKLRAAIKI